MKFSVMLNYLIILGKTCYIHILYKAIYTYISFTSFGYYRVIDWYTMLCDAMLCYIMLYYGRKLILKMNRILVAISFQSVVSVRLSRYKVGTLL